MYRQYQKVYTATTGTETYLGVEAILKRHDMTSFFCGKGVSDFHQSNLYRSTVENFCILLIKTYTDSLQ